MNTSKTVNAQISAFADGDLNPVHDEQILALLRRAESRETWEKYHQIGEALRSSGDAIILSPGFEARMAARLAAEEAHVDVGTLAASCMASSPLAGFPAASVKQVQVRRRFGMPGAAVAVAVVLTVAAGSAVTDFPGSALNGFANVDKPGHIIGMTADTTRPVVLRDAGIDGYLIAHQRFSPSVYSTAQYARSSTFASEQIK